MPESQSSGSLSEAVVNQVTSIVSRQEQTVQELRQDVAKMRDSLTTILPLVQQIDRQMQSTRRALYGDPESGFRSGLIEQMALLKVQMEVMTGAVHDMQPKVQSLLENDATRTRKEIESAAQRKLITSLSLFFGVTNMAGIVTLLGFLTHVIRLP